jgi:hypothetical protein
LTVRDRLRFARRLGAFARGERTAAALSAVGQLCRANLWHPSNETERAAEAAPVPLMGAHFHRCASTPPASSSSRCLPPEKSPLGSRLRVTFVAAPSPLANGGRMPHGFIEPRKLRLDLHDVTFVSVFEAACASTAFADECFNEHDCRPLEHSRPPGERLERLSRSIGSCLPSRTTAGGTQGQGSRIRASTLPTVIAHDRDFAPTPIAPGTSCREAHFSPYPERRGEKTGSPATRRPARLARRKGSCGGRFPRRNLMLTNPRYLPS